MTSISPTEDSRLAIIIRLERLAMAGRYLAMVALLSLFMLGQFDESGRDIAFVTAVVFMHNGFVHTVLWTKRFSLFQTPLNFLVHLLMSTLVVLFTGAEHSDFFVLYLFMLIGYTAYSRRYGMILLAAVICCFSYGAVLGAEWVLEDLDLPIGAVSVKLFSILVCGWLVANISELLRLAEDAAHDRARELQSSEAALRMILDSTADPIMVYDEDGNVTDVNNRACEFLNIPREEIIGRPFRTFLFDDGTLDSMLAEVHAKGDHHGEQVFIDAEGGEMTVELHMRSFRHGNQGFFVVVAHDVTEQKNLHEAARLGNVNLARLNRELQQVNELKTGLIRMVSQKLRSPLTAILGYLDLLLDEELGELLPDQRKSLQTCRRSTVRIFRLLDESFGGRPADFAPATPEPHTSGLPARSTHLDSL
jgi:PAS domain S-box-containing protein